MSLETEKKPTEAEPIEKPAKSEKPIDSKKEKSERLRSIDALRGFDMFWIAGGTDLIYRFLFLFNKPFAEAVNVQFEHVAWNGFAFYDLIFVLFLFIAGMSISFSITKRLEKGDDRKEIYVHLIKRTIILLIIGFFYNNGLAFFYSGGKLILDYQGYRYLGVLHRIAICTFIAALIVMNTNKKSQFIIAILILLGYWAIMMLVPVPGYGAGDLSPEGNLAGYIDRLYLPGKYCCYIYGDSEGLLSMIPAISTALLGALCGDWIRGSHTQNEKVTGLLVFGVISLSVGWGWGFIFPVNKYLWSSTFVLFAAGWSFLLVALFYWLIDIKKFEKWAFFFIVIGMNSLLCYLAGGLADIDGLADFINLGIATMFILSLAGWILRWGVLYILWKKKKFIKI